MDKRKTAYGAMYAENLWNAESCCCCGFISKHGVYVAQSMYSGTRRVFVCEKCFMDPNLFFSAKRVLPHWTLTVKMQSIRNRFAHDYAREHGDNLIGAVLTKKAKREVAMSESLYKGQKQLENFK